MQMVGIEENKLPVGFCRNLSAFRGGPVEHGRKTAFEHSRARGGLRERHLAGGNLNPRIGILVNRLARGGGLGEFIGRRLRAMTVARCSDLHGVGLVAHVEIEVAKT